MRINWAKGVDLKTGVPLLDRESADFSDSPKIIFPGTPGARTWYPASYSAKAGLYYASVVAMGNLMFVPPGSKGLNTNAALICTPHLKCAQSIR